MKIKAIKINQKVYKNKCRNVSIGSMITNLKKKLNTIDSCKKKNNIKRNV